MCSYRPEMSVRIAISCWLVAVAAIFTAFVLEYVAREDFGFAQHNIRTLSLNVAAVIAIVVAVEYFGKMRRRPK